MTKCEQDRALAEQITSLGLTAPRVLPEQIDDLVEQLSFHTYVIPGTTVTVAAAIAPGNIVVALGKSGAASAANFNEVIGRNRAIAIAKDSARGALWELEGYRLKRNLLDLQEVGGLEAVLKVAAELPVTHADAWPAVATPSAVVAQVNNHGADDVEVIKQRARDAADRICHFSAACGDCACSSVDA